MKKVLKIIGVIVIICLSVIASVFLMGKYDNPVSRFITKKTVRSYIDANYPTSDFIVGDVSCAVYADGYRVVIESSEDPLMYFVVYTDGWGRVYEEYLEENKEVIEYCELEYFNCTYGALKEDNRTAEFIVEFSLCDDTEETTTVLKIGDASLNTIKEATEDGKGVYTAVYESDIFANWYDISGLAVEITVTNADGSVTMPVEREQINDLHNLLSDAFLDYLPPVKSFYEENEISCEYDGEVLNVNGILKFEADITGVSDMYIVTEINDEIAKKTKCTLSQTEYIICDEYKWKNADYVAVYAVFEDVAHNYICKYELAHWLKGGSGWLGSDYVYDKDGNLLNEPYQPSADIQDFWEDSD